MRSSPDETGPAPPPGRGTLIRDALAFQAKLFFDGFLDVVLSPLSILAALVSLLRPSARPGAEFYDLLKLARRSERWINLFSAADRVHGPERAEAVGSPGDVDSVVRRIESFVVDEYKTGKISRQAKDRIGRALSDMRSREEGGENR